MCFQDQKKKQCRSCGDEYAKDLSEVVPCGNPDCKGIKPQVTYQMSGKCSKCKPKTATTSQSTDKTT